MGCYVHGLFAADGFRHAFLARLKARASSGLAFEQRIETTLDALADHLEAHADLYGLLALARSRGG
jgi:adenosylcobyric acid synthase